MLTYFKSTRVHKKKRLLRRLRLLKKPSPPEQPKEKLEEKETQTEPEQPEEPEKKKKVVRHWIRDIATDGDFNYRCYVSVDEAKPHRATIQLAHHEEGCCFGRPDWTYNKCDCVDFTMIYN